MIFESGGKLDSSMEAPIRRLRWWICLLLFLVTVSNYVDRQTISIVAPVIASEFHFTNSEIAIIVNAFLLAYAVGQFFSGAFMDMAGSRRGFTIVVLLWSAASILTSLARGVFSFSFFRFLLGASESGNFPGGIKVVAEWFPEQERSTAVGLFISGSSIGAILTPPIVAFLVVHVGWQLAFVIVGMPGLLWVFAWRALYRPLHSHRRLGDEERGHIVTGRSTAEVKKPASAIWRLLIRRRMFWGVFLGRFVEEPASWFYLTWLPLYLRIYRGVSLLDAGILLTIPFITLDLGYVGGGWIASLLIKAGWSLSRARKSVMVMCAILMVSAVPAVFAPTTAGFISLVSIATLGHGGWASNIMTLPGDMLPHQDVGTLYGFTAFGGGMGSILFMQITGKLVDLQRSFNTVFVVAGMLPLIAAAIVLTVTGRIYMMQLSNDEQRVQQSAV